MSKSTAIFSNFGMTRSQAIACMAGTAIACAFGFGAGSLFGVSGSGVGTFHCDCGSGGCG